MDVPTETIARAVESLVPANPLHDVLLARTAAAAPLLLEQLGGATVQLARVLVTSAAGDQARNWDSFERSPLVHLLLYMDANLTDPSLAPDRVAAAHNISVRHL